MGSFNPYTEEQKLLTRESLQGALFQLMAGIRFSKISISQVCEKAGVSRMAFYRNYESKEQVLVDFFDNYLSRFYQQLDSIETKEAYQISVLYFDYVKNNAQLFTRLIASGAEHVLFERFTHYVSKFFSDNVQGMPFEGDFEKYWNSYVSAGLYNMTVQWIKGGMKEPVALLAEISAKISG